MAHSPGPHTDTAIGGTVAVAAMAAAPLAAQLMAPLSRTPISFRFESAWEAGVAGVTEFAAENGHVQVPSDHVAPDGYPTGKWVRATREKFNAGQLAAWQIAELEALPGWVWAPPGGSG